MKDHEDSNRPDLNGAMAQAFAFGHGRSLGIDLERYQTYLDDEDLSPAHKEEVIRALWTIISNFVELGFNVHPTQQSCGQVGEPSEASNSTEPDVLSLRANSVQTAFNDAPDRK
ncbi:MAG: hypothetical protein AAF636_16040 [Pseudomonadota bacterium]